MRASASRLAAMHKAILALLALVGWQGVSAGRHPVQQGPIAHPRFLQQANTTGLSTCDAQLMSYVTDPSRWVLHHVSHQASYRPISGCPACLHSSGASYHASSLHAGARGLGMAQQTSSGSCQGPTPVAWRTAPALHPPRLCRCVLPALCTPTEQAWPSAARTQALCWAGYAAKAQRPPAAPTHTPGATQRASHTLSARLCSLRKPLQRAGGF